MNTTTLCHRLDPAGLEKDEAKRLIAKALELLRFVNQGQVTFPGGISEIHMEKAFGIPVLYQS